MGTPGFYRINKAASPDNLLVVKKDIGACCDDQLVDLSTYTSAAANLTANPVESIEIGGTTYTFDTPASTQALLETGIRAALTSAGYQEFDGVAYSVSGAVTATVVVLKTTATVTKMTNDAPADIAFTAS